MTRAVKKKLKAIAENTKLVYDAGVEIGKAEGGGGNTEQILDEFASTLQLGGARTDFSNMFKNSTITDETIGEIFARWNSTIIRANYMFKDAKNLQEGLYTDVLDFSQCVTLLEAFSGSGVTKLKKIDARATMSGFNGMASMFMSCKNLESIDEFYPSLNTKFMATFYACTNLVKVIFMSEIAVDGLAFNFCSKLNKESIESVFTNLSDTTTGLTVIFSPTSVNKAFETSEGANDGLTSPEWLALVGTKPNWNIAFKEGA